MPASVACIFAYRLGLVVHDREDEEEDPYSDVTLDIGQVSEESSSEYEQYSDEESQTKDKRKPDKKSKRADSKNKPVAKGKQKDKKDADTSGSEVDDKSGDDEPYRRKPHRKSKIDRAKKKTNRYHSSDDDDDDDDDYYNDRPIHGNNRYRDRYDDRYRDRYHDRSHQHRRSASNQRRPDPRPTRPKKTKEHQRHQQQPARRSPGVPSAFVRRNGDGSFSLNRPKIKSKKRISDPAGIQDCIAVFGVSLTNVTQTI